MAGNEPAVGNAAAEDEFRRLYAENFGAVLKYALRRVARADDASDLVAETFLIAWRRRAEMPPGDEARLWLYGVARRLLANHGRGEQRRLRLGERLRLELREHLTFSDPTAELVDARTVGEALSVLGRSDREVLELSVWEQLEPREIAVALDLSPEVVRARLSRARARMRKSGFLGHDSARRGNEPGVRTVLAPKEGKA